MNTPHTDRAAGAMSAAAAAGPGHPVAAPSLRALVEAATPGPWRGCAHVNGTDTDCPCRYPGDVVSEPTDAVTAYLGPCRCEHDDEKCRHLGLASVDTEQGYANGRFIAASREAVPLLLDVFDRAKAIITPDPEDDVLDDDEWDPTALELRQRVRAFETWERER